MPRYELKDAKSNKFWEIELSGKSFTTTFGRIGTAGQRSVKKFKTDAAAQAAYEQIVKEKVKKGYKLAGKAKPGKQVKPDKRLDALLAIGALLAPKAKRLAAEVTHAFTDPQGYIKAHEKRMNDRAIAPGDKVPNLPWIVLIDQLEDAKALSEIDWKCEREDVEWNIAKLSKGFKLPEEDEEESTLEMLERAGIALRKKQLQLVQLDMGSDAYPLAVVPIGKVGELQKLGKQANYGDVDLFGDGLESAKQERLERMAALRKKRDEMPEPPAPKYVHYARGDESWWIKVAQTAFDTGYDAPSAKYYVSHCFPSEAATKAGAKAKIAEWLADGFVETNSAKSHHPNAAYIGWTAPFPETGRYFLFNKVVYYIEHRGKAVWTTAGTLGKNFGELQNVHYEASEAAAERAHAAELERYAKQYKPTTRDVVLTKYPKPKDL